MKKIVLIIALAVIAGVGTAHWYFSDRGRFTTAPELIGLARVMTPDGLVSTRDPPVILRVDPVFRHLGGQKFVLYGVADTEQHFFVETTPDDELKSLYWVQFEAYLPDNDYHYNYDDSPLRRTIGDYDFFVDTLPVHSDPDRKRRRGTDGAMMRQFIARHGYAIPRDFFYARMVHLPDTERRKELMIIYIEDLAPIGLTGTELGEEGSAREQWPAIESRYLDRIGKTLTLEHSAR